MHQNSHDGKELEMIQISNNAVEFNAAIEKMLTENISRCVYNILLNYSKQITTQRAQDDPVTVFRCVYM